MMETGHEPVPARSRMPEMGRRRKDLLGYRHYFKHQPGYGEFSYQKCHAQASRQQAQPCRHESHSVGISRKHNGQRHSRAIMLWHCAKALQPGLMASPTERSGPGHGAIAPATRYRPNVVCPESRVNQQKPGEPAKAR
jgi:hypothetical protein